MILRLQQLQNKKQQAGALEGGSAVMVFPIL
jgi:hypothetical protein